MGQACIPVGCKRADHPQGVGLNAVPEYLYRKNFCNSPFEDSCKTESLAPDLFVWQVGKIKQGESTHAILSQESANPSLCLCVFAVLFAPRFKEGKSGLHSTLFNYSSFHSFRHRKGHGDVSYVYPYHKNPCHSPTRLNGKSRDA